MGWRRNLRLLVLLLFIPVLVAALAIWAIRGQGSFDVTHTQAAVVNLDEGAEVTMPDTGETQFVPFGRQLAAALMDPESSDASFQWSIMQKDSAEQALKAGNVAVVVTIPQNFSTRLATLGTPKATPGVVAIMSSDATSPIVNRVGNLVTKAAARTLGNLLGTQLLDGIYLGFDTMKTRMGQAVDGADQLAGGLRQLTNGLDQFSLGVDQALGGTQELAEGMNKLQGGSTELAGGMSALNDGVASASLGATQLAGGLHLFRDGFVGTPNQPGLLVGINQLAQGIKGDGTANNPGLAYGTEQLADGTRQLSDGIAQFDQVLDPIRESIPDDLAPSTIPGNDINVQDLITTARQLAHSTRDLLMQIQPIMSDPTTAHALGDSLQVVVDSCPKQAFPQYCQQVEDLATQINPILQNLPDNAQDSINQIDTFLVATSGPKFEKQIADAQALLDSTGGIWGALIGPHGALDGIHQLAVGAQQLAQAAGQISTGVNGTPTTIGLVQGVNQLQDGALQMAAALDGTTSQPGLVAGAQSLADGLDDAANGSGQLTSGANQLSVGIAQAENGAQLLADNMPAISEGAHQLADASDQAQSGASQLADGLGEAVDQIPTYSDAERERIVKMAITPVEAETLGISPQNAALAYPFAAALLIWLCAFGIFLVDRPLRKGLVAQPIGGIRVVLGSVWKPALITGASVVASIILAAAFNVHPSSWVSTVVVLIVSGATALLVHQAVFAALSERWGRVISMVGLMVQTVALTGILPLQDPPAVVLTANTVLPLGTTVRALQFSVLGVGSGWVSYLLILLVWSLAAFVTSVVAVSGRRSTSPQLIRRRMRQGVDITSQGL